MLDQPRLARFEGAVEIKAAFELLGEVHVLVQQIAIRAEHPQDIRAEYAIVARHELCGFTAEERRLERDLRLDVARKQLLELDEAVDERERHLRSEHRILAAAYARVRLENRVARLLNGERDDLADLGDFLRSLITDDRDAAKADVVEFVQRCLHPDAGRQMGKQFPCFIAWGAEPDLTACRSLQLFVREHATP